ncbi:hypothetical protein HU200_036232 [Digitaria exilis]|uniref:Uncharacterized protein n=1 Tax=Digitaria exilis TaxID=1010633 RepID=A0A835BEC3_9POAL|nr:hypothetical protein HU200_036232 [Digitaria exilis]
MFLFPLRPRKTVPLSISPASRQRQGMYYASSAEEMGAARVILDTNFSERAVAPWKEGAIWCPAAGVCTVELRSNVPPRTRAVPHHTRSFLRRVPGATSIRCSRSARAGRARSQCRSLARFLASLSCPGLGARPPRLLLVECACRPRRIATSIYHRANRTDGVTHATLLISSPPPPPPRLGIYHSRTPSVLHSPHHRVGSFISQSAGESAHDAPATDKLEDNSMGTEAPAMAGKKKPPPPLPLPLPPALFVARARSRATRVADMGGSRAAAWPWTPDTPPRRSPVTVPFLWEEAPGKPKPPPPPPPRGDEASLSPAGAVHEDSAADGEHGNGNGGADEARPAPLKLPPRLQRVASAKQQRDVSLSPKTVLHGPYYGCVGGGKRPPRRTTTGGGGGLAAFRRMPSGGVSLFSKTSKNRGGGHRDHLSSAMGPDAPCCSPAASSTSSSSSSSSFSTSCFGDEHRRLADGQRQDGSSEEDECAKGSVRITRFRRNRSLPSMMTTSHLWVRRRLCSLRPCSVLLPLWCLSCSVWSSEKNRNQRWMGLPPAPAGYAAVAAPGGKGKCNTTKSYAAISH